MRKLAIGALLVIAAAANAQTFVSQLFYGGHDYGLFTYDGTIPNDWASTNAWTNSFYGGIPGTYIHLATITSAGEQAAVASLVGASGLNEVWLGGYQTPGTLVPNANWNWVTGEPWGYTNWNGGEPNDNYGPGSEQYLAMWSYGAWNDEGALGNINGFVLEAQPAVPAPAALIPFGLGLVAIRRRARR